MTKYMKSIFILICISILSYSCSDDSDAPIFFSKADSPHYITEHIETKKGQTITIEPGAELIISDSINIVCFGDVICKGTEEDPIIIRAENPSPGWGTMRLKNEAKIFRLYHTTVENGTLMSYNTDNHFDHVTFVNTQDLNWEWAAARFWYGKVLLENCSVTGVNKAEGFLLHNVQEPIVRNNQFYTVPDGVEYIDCKNGEITNNVFRDSGDDAIDLNSCENIIIQGNDISGLHDAGMELGSENFGRSINIMTKNNVIRNSKYGILLKESSTATFENDSLISNEIGFYITTPADSTIITSAVIKRCYMESKIEDIKKDEKSLVKIE